MPDLITTKPGDKYRSIQRPRVYRALRRRGMSKEQAARISNAQAPGHRVKAPNYGARAGQVIIGGLARGGDGKFTSAGSASGSAPKPASDATVDATPKPKKLTAAARAAERQRKLIERVRKRAERKREQAERARTRLQERAARQAEIKRRAEERAAARLAKQQEPKKGGGGGGGKKKPEAAGLSTDQALDLMRRAAGLKSTLAVFKDATGHDRWLAISSTAYRDRDGEIVSCKALEQAVAAGDAAQNRGPLRFWHVPGLDIGDCDYQATAQDGRFLIESGTFRSPAYAQAVKARGTGYQMSIGFAHPASQPDANGIFTDIAIFERSIVPPGMASNPFTSITTKEQRMLSAERLAALKTLMGDTPELDALLAQVQTTDKTAQAQGVAFKDAPELETITVNGLTFARVIEKEAPPAAAPAAAGAAAVEVVEEEPAADDQPILGPADVQAVVQGLGAYLAPLLKIEEKVNGALASMQQMASGAAGAVATKDAEIATIKAEQAKLDQRLKELEGEQPAIRTTYRATDDPALVVGTSRSTIDPFADINEKLLGLAPTS